METFAAAIAVIVLVGAGIGALKHFMKGQQGDASKMAIIGLLVSSILWKESRDMWKTVISAVITLVAKIITNFTGAM